MFDVGLSELMVIGVVALIVIGPERLPRVARTVGHLLGRLQRYVNTVKSDINREMHLEDLKRFEQRMSSELSSIESSVSASVSSAVAGVAHDLQTMESDMSPQNAPDIAVSPALTCGESPPGKQAATPDDLAKNKA
jgi:sec-independent protein translocase protein TatB